MKRLIVFCLSVALFSPLILQTRTLAQESFFSQAPMLDALVASGSLPPVNERLPQNPVVITPLEQAGVYGGTWNMAMVNKDTTGYIRIAGFENLMRWDPNWTKVVPNVAQSVDVNEDATRFTFRLREGMRWSDGALFTAEDIVFWYDAVLNNPELTPGGNGGMTVEQLGDYEVAFHFVEPRGLFLQDLSSFFGINITATPKHYAAQFHPDYNTDVDQLVAEAGVASWVDLFTSKTNRLAEGLPTLNAWVVEVARFEPSAEGDPIVRAVRNPYYWKIDTDFNQLPYIDVLEFQVVPDREAIAPLALAGQIDMQDRNIDPHLALPENQAAGGYGLYTLTPSFANYMAISFNQTHTDPIKRAIFRNRDFRIAMSHALNRPAMIAASGLDVAPSQVAPTRGTPWYSETMRTQYIEYDVALANEYLDRAGYSARDEEGFRLGPDGARIHIMLMIADPTPSTDYSTYLPQIEANWEAVGIEITLEPVPRQEYERRSFANDFDAAVFLAEGGLDTLQAPRNFIPVFSPWSQQGILWSDWFQGRPSGEEPPSPILEAVNLYRQILGTSDIDRQIDLMRQVMAIVEQEFHVIGIHDVPLTYGIIRPDFHNVPAFSFFSSNYPNPAPTNPSQYYIDPQS